jgi:hypothetical protein
VIGGTPVAVRLTRGWTRVYTAGLTGDVRDARRDEVACDLWEQQLDDRESGLSGGNTARAMLSRLGRGLAADLAWRVEQRRPTSRTRQMIDAIQQNSWQRNGLWVLVTILAVAYLSTGVAISTNDGRPGEGIGSYIAIGGGNIISGVLLLVGFFVSERHPTAGSVLVVIGALGGALLMWWMFFTGLPLLALGVLIFGLRRARGFSRPGGSSGRGGPPSGAASA